MIDNCVGFQVQNMTPRKERFDNARILISKSLLSSIPTPFFAYIFEVAGCRHREIGSRNLRRKMEYNQCCAPGFCNNRPSVQFLLGRITIYLWLNTGRLDPCNKCRKVACEMINQKEDQGAIPDCRYIDVSIIGYSALVLACSS